MSLFSTFEFGTEIGGVELLIAESEFFIRQYLSYWNFCAWESIIYSTERQIWILKPINCHNSKPDVTNESILFETHDKLHSMFESDFNILIANELFWIESHVIRKWQDLCRNQMNRATDFCHWIIKSYKMKCYVWVYVEIWLRKVTSIAFINIAIWFRMIWILDFIRVSKLSNADVSTRFRQFHGNYHNFFGTGFLFWMEKAQFVENWNKFIL